MEITATRTLLPKSFIHRSVICTHSRMESTPLLARNAHALSTLNARALHELTLSAASFGHPLVIVPDLDLDQEMISPLFPLILLALRLLAFFLLFSSTLSFRAADEVFVRVQRSNISAPISPNFIGFSLEHDIATSWTGRGHVRPSFVNLMAQLQQTSYAFGGPTIRIGGNSADYSWSPYSTVLPSHPPSSPSPRCLIMSLPSASSLRYNPTGLPIPHMPGFDFTYNITDIDITSLASGARAANLSLIIGLNFRRPSNASWAVAHMQAVQRLVGFEGKTIKAVELGNEVDDYASNGNREKNYTMHDYYTEFAFYSAALKKEVPKWPAQSVSLRHILMCNITAH